MAKVIGKDFPQIPWEEPKNPNDIIWRYSCNPIISRNPVEGVSRIFNSAVVYHEGKFKGVFRGDTNTTIPNLYYGESDDGIHFTFNKEPIKFYLENGEVYKFEYGYDPRVVEIDGIFYIMWCDGKNGGPLICLAKTQDFKKYTIVSWPFLPCNRNGVLFPRKFGDDYLMLSRPSDNGHTAFGDIYISRSNDLKRWGDHELLMKPTYNWWEGLKVGAGSAPIETDEGWIMFYHGVTRTCNGYVYSIGAALLDRDNPTKIIKRLPGFIMTPEKDYETTGFVPNVLFPVSSFVDAKTGRIAIYYGAADTYTALAFTTVDKLMKLFKE